MQDKLPKIIVITGAESTGKSVLTRQMASHFKAPFYLEYAREYILNLGRKYTIDDLNFIAHKQIEEYSKALQSDAQVVFFDTWLIITKVWFEVVYGQAPLWVSDFISTAKISGFIVCDTDLPWEADGIRENGGEMREVLQQLYIENLNYFNFNYFLVQGNGLHRFENARKALENSMDIE